MKLNNLIIFFSLFALAACQRSADPQPVASLYNATSPTEYPKEFEAMFKFLELDEPTDNAFDAWKNSAAVKQFTPDVIAIYPTIDELEKNLGGILDNAAKQGLNLPKRKYAAVVWGKLKSIAFVDSCTLIALNHYLGADYPGYAQWPQYMRKDKTPQRLPYDIAEALVATQYPYEGSTALSRMLYEGSLAYAKMCLVPDAKLSEALGYSTEQLKWLEDNEYSIWVKIVGDKLLFDTSQRVAEQLTAPSPATTIIAANVPGRAGRYIGYRLILNYLDNNPSSTLLQLISPTLYNDDSILQHTNITK